MILFPLSSHLKLFDYISIRINQINETVIMSCVVGQLLHQSSRIKQPDNAEEGKSQKYLKNEKENSNFYIIFC